MRRAVHVLLFCGICLLAYSFLSSSLSPFAKPAENLPGGIEDPSLKFDSLRTDLGDYMWPTNASKKMSSGFASFRASHFHAGIDISTNGRTGYKVFASRDGYVSRVSVSPYGYGKLLHVKHADGFTTVYAHLQGFSPALDEYVRQQQYKNERYGFDARFDEPVFPVSKGDVIAYTGDTGVGPPHLHFEIRDEHMNPVHPLLCPDFAAAIKDTRPPEIRQIGFSPFDFASRVDGGAAPMILNVRNQGYHRYTIPRVIHLNGSVGISIKASDQTDATWQRSNIHHYELYIDSVLVFASALDRFAARESEQIAIHYDWSLLRSGRGRFEKLFLEPGNNLPFYSRLPERAGVLSTSEFTRGEHTIRIVAGDIAGNTSELTGIAVFDDPPTIDVRKTEEHYVLVSPDSALKSITVSSRLPGGKNWKRATYDPATLTSTSDGYVLPIEAGPQVVRIMARDNFGSQSNPVFFSSSTSRSSNTSIRLEKDFLRDYLLVTVSSHLPFSLRPTLWLADTERRVLLDIDATDERTYVGTIPLSSVKGGNVRLEASAMVNGTSVEAFDEFSIFPISHDAGGTIVTSDGTFTIEFPPGGVYQPLYCRIEKNEDGYTVLPRDVLLNRGAIVSYRAAAGENLETMGLYHAGREELDLLSTKQQDGVFTARVQTLLGDFALKEDAAPPSITELRVRISGKRLRFSARIQDSGSGVNANSIRLTIDDTLLIAAYNPYNHSIAFDEPFPLQAGAHVIRVQAGDRMGNESTATKTFRTTR